MREHGIDYFENSRRATYAQRPTRWPTRGLERLRRERLGPDGERRPRRPERDQRRPVTRTFRRLFRARRRAWTISPTTAPSHRPRGRGSIAFAPEIVIPAIEEMKKQLRRAHLHEVRLRRRVQSELRLRQAELRTRQARPGLRLGRHRYLGIDQGPIVLMIENYRERLRVAVMQQEPVRPPGPAARRLHRWLARRTPTPWPRTYGEARSTRAFRGRTGAGARRLLAAGCASRRPARDPAVLDHRPRRRGRGTAASRVRARAPGIRVSGAAAAAHRRAREAAHRVRRRCDARTSASSATPGFPRWSRSARSSRSTRAWRSSKVVDPKDYFPAIWSTNVIDGTLYGVPWYVDTRLLFYRKDLLAKVGYDRAAARLGRVAGDDGDAVRNHRARPTACCCRPTSSSSC